MAMQAIKNGGFVAEEISKINANFSEIENDYAKQTDIPAVPTKTSDLTNDSGFITSSAIPSVPTKTSQLTNDSGYITSSAIANKVDKEAGKGLSTEDFTTAFKTKLNGLKAPTKVTFTTNSWTNGTFTTAANSQVPTVVMRKSGSNYGIALVDAQLIGTNVVITSDEAFEGYVILV